MPQKLRVSLPAAVGLKNSSVVKACAILRRDQEHPLPPARFENGWWDAACAGIHARIEHSRLQADNHAQQLTADDQGCQ